MASDPPSSAIDSIAPSQNTHLEYFVIALTPLNKANQKLREASTQLQDTQASSKQELAKEILELQNMQKNSTRALEDLVKSTNDVKSQLTPFREGQEKLERLANSMNQQIKAVIQWQQDEKRKQEQMEDEMRKEDQRKQEELQAEERRVRARDQKVNWQPTAQVHLLS